MGPPDKKETLFLNLEHMQSLQLTREELLPSSSKIQPAEHDANGLLGC